MATLLNELRETGVVLDYALFGAVAQMRYTEPVATLDVDVLVTVPEPDRIDVLSDVYRACERCGFAPEGEGVRVGTWPVQFVPVFSGLTREALEQAESVDFDGVPLRVVRAVHLAVIALSVGRAKDHARVLGLLESRAVRADEVERLAGLHGLEEKWSRFRARFVDA